MLSAARSSIKKAKEALQEGKSLLDDRQKLILLVDRSEHGWDIIIQYVANALEENLRRIKKVHKAAKKAAEKRNAAKNKNIITNILYLKIVCQCYRQ